MFVIVFMVTTVHEPTRMFSVDDHEPEINVKKNMSEYMYQ